MANFLSFFANSKVNPDQPSIFPIMATLNFKKELPAAFTHLITWEINWTWDCSTIICYVCLRYLAETYPNSKLNWLHRFSHELYLAIDLGISALYLKNVKGLLTEHFYGLKRRKIRKTTLLIHIGIPYVLAKLEYFCNENDVPSLFRTANAIQQTLQGTFNLILSILYTSGHSK